MNQLWPVQEFSVRAWYGRLGKHGRVLQRLKDTWASQLAAMNLSWRLART